MSTVKFFAFAVALCCATVAFAADNGSSIALNFGADEPSAAGEGMVFGAAGVAGTQNWNNLVGATGNENVFNDVGGAETDAGAFIEWTAQGSWASDGRGNEDTNEAPEGNDRSLMLGYMDTSDVSVSEFLIGDIPEDLAAGYDVILYVQNGVLDRGGDYTVTAGSSDPITQSNVTRSIFDGTYVEGAEGNYLVYRGLSGSELTVNAMATPESDDRIGDGFRGPVNAIEICAVDVCLAPPVAPGPTEAIGFNFNSDRENAALAVGDMAGVVPQGNWNNWDGIQSADVVAPNTGDASTIASPNAGVVTDSGGSALSGVSVSWESWNAWNTDNGVSNGDNQLMNGYLDNNADNPQITFSVDGLPAELADERYHVYAYIGSDGNGRTGTITDGTTTYSYSTFSQQAGDFPAKYTQTTDTAGGNPDANYAVFTGLTGPGFTLMLDRGSNNSGIHGVQVVLSPCDPTTMGDIDGNGVVEFADFLTLSDNFGDPAIDETTGDVNCNGVVDFPDFLELSNNFGNTVPAASASAVPEPSGFALLSIAGLLVGLLRRRRG